jgi:hypothetical protein
VIVGLLVQVTPGDRVVRQAHFVVRAGLTAVEPAEARLSHVG